MRLVKMVSNSSDPPAISSGSMKFARGGGRRGALRPMPISDPEPLWRHTDQKPRAASALGRHLSSPAHVLAIVLVRIAPHSPPRSASNGHGGRAETVLAGPGAFQARRGWQAGRSETQTGRRAVASAQSGRGLAPCAEKTPSGVFPAHGRRISRPKAFSRPNGLPRPRPVCTRQPSPRQSRPPVRSQSCAPRAARARTAPTVFPERSCPRGAARA